MVCDGFIMVERLTVISISSVLREACRIGYKDENVTKEDAPWRLLEDLGANRS